MKRNKSEYVRAQKVAKRLLKPSWVNRYHGGDDAAAARELAEQHGFSGRIPYMRLLCTLITAHPEQAAFEQAVRDRHQLGLRLMAEGLAHCEITDNPELVKGEAPFTDSVVGDCYRQAYYYVTDTAPAESFLIHGHIREGGGSDEHIGHAWVELPGDILYDGVLQRFYRREGYYEKRAARRTRAFTKHEALMTYLKYPYFGQWA